MAYVVAPFTAWLLSGSLKFLVNSLRARSPAWKQIGMGRWPSTHAAIVSATAFLVGLREGWDAPVFGVALTVAFIVVIDALDLRRRVERHAVALNRLLRDDADWPPLRERIGHRWHEAAAGLATGLACAWLIHVGLPLSGAP